jgi:hypothetical protein
LGIHPADGAEHSQGKLVHGHFETENRDRQFIDNGRMLYHVHGQGGLSHAGASGKDDQVRGLKSGGHMVEVGEPCCHAGDVLLAFKEFFDAFKGAGDDGGHGHKAGAFFGTGDLKDRLLRLVDQGVDVVLLLVAAGSDFGRGLDQFTEN